MAHLRPCQAGANGMETMVLFCLEVAEQAPHSSLQAGPTVLCVPSLGRFSSLKRSEGGVGALSKERTCCEVGMRLWDSFSCLPGGREAAAVNTREAR